MTVFLITSALVHGVKALSGMFTSTSRSIAPFADVMSPLESLLGHKGRRFATEANKAYSQVGRMVLNDSETSG
jgi:hypothetical protein